MSQTIQDFFRVAQERGFSRDFMMKVRAIGNTTFNEEILKISKRFYVETL